MIGQDAAAWLRHRRAGPGLTACVLCCLCVPALPARAQSAGSVQDALTATPLRAPTFRLVPLDAVFAPVPFPAWIGLPQAAPDTATSEAGRGTVAELGVRIRGSGDLAGAWTRQSPCEPGLRTNCNANLAQLRPDLQLAVEVRGGVSERVHIDVDYDQAREFEATNRVRARYEGRPGEALQRIELGDVSLRLPASRYLTRGVPAGNFGLITSAQLGPVEVQALFAQQKGDVLTREFHMPAGRTGIAQDATLSLDDADYVRSQFFFLVEPSQLNGYPHVDVLRLQAADAPASARPAAGGVIAVYRDERLPPALQAGAGAVLAEAVAPGAAGERHTGVFRRLVPEQEYTVHGSGLWLVLRTPLRPDEALAIAYVTAAGDTVGSLNAEAAPAGMVPRLGLVRGGEASHRPGSATWPLEMRQVYRLDGASAVDPEAITLHIGLGEAAARRTFLDVLGRRLSYLRLFGLDEDAPADVLDAARVYQPAREVPGGVDGTWIVFPTLRPFAAPAPLRSAGLSGDDLLDALGSDANAAIYEAADAVSRTAGGRFRLGFGYRVAAEAAASTLSLGAFGIREGSERLYLGGRQLERNIDYVIDYDVGIVTLTGAGSMGGAGAALAGTDAELRATWEQQPLFSIAPTNVFGATARYDLGARGEIGATALYQAERTLLTRPLLGAEPGAAFVGGMSGRFELGGALFERALNAAGIRPERASSATLTAEVAFSAPNPNRAGRAYVDDFETLDEIPLRPRRQDWRLGSAPQSVDGDRGTLPASRDAATAVPLVWQHDIAHAGVQYGALLPHRDIDATINVFGTEQPEQVMWLNFGRAAGAAAPLPEPADRRRWRAITTVLSPTGLDLSRTAHLELYVRADAPAPLALVLDIGTVGEDAFHVDAQGRTSGAYPDGRRWGLGVLDEEASVIAREVWGAESDRRGLWDQDCTGDALRAFPLGDPRANCTRGNGAVDSEDLNGNGVLDADDGPYFRYVVELDRLSEYLVRDTSHTRTGFRLYRIPLNGGAAVHGASEDTWRAIRHLRLTVTGEAAGVQTLTLARMRFVGSRWNRRDGAGVQRGRLASEPGSAGTTVSAGHASRLTHGARYASPPGVVDDVLERGSQYRTAGAEINEKSLRIDYDALQPDERAEVYFRYPQQPRNLLAYRELRLWVLPVHGSWGADGDERFSVRIGTDPNNYYLYQTRLRTPLGDRAAVPADWLPELVIDFEPWLALKAEAERLLLGGAARGAHTLWSADSSYAIVFEDRARAPNLAAVRELAFAVYNAGAVPAQGEVWIDELRTGRADARPGGAGNIRLDVAGGDVVNASIALSNRGSLFRQLGETPDYVGGSELAFAADARLDRLLPEAWAVELPLTVSHTRHAESPRFLPRSDVETARLGDVRASGARTTRIGLQVSRRAPLANPYLGLLVDGTALRLGYTTSSTSAPVSRMASTGFTGELSYRRNPERHDFALLPGGARDAMGALLPAALAGSEPVRRLLDSRLRWSPASLSFATMLHDHTSRAFRYDAILELPDDTAVRALDSPRRGLRNDAHVALRPFDPLQLSVSLSSDRDLLGSARAATTTPERSALEAARTSIAGVDIGWETARVLGTSLSYRPDITRWLRAGYGWTNRYTTDRSPAFLQLDADGSARLQHRFESARVTSQSLAVLPRALLEALHAESGAVARLLLRLERVEVVRRSALSSRFERVSGAPSFAYQLGFGSIDAFTFMHGDTARRVQQRDQLTIGGSVAVLPGTRLDVAGAETRTRTLDVRGGSHTLHEVAWPRVALAWRAPPLPRPLQALVTAVTGSVGIQRTTREQSFGADAAQRRSSSDLEFPLSLALHLPQDVQLSWRASFSSGSALDPSGSAASGGRQQDLSLSARLRPPQSLAAVTRSPITLAVSLAEQQQRRCRDNAFAGIDDGCIVFLDAGTRSANVRMETKLSDMDVGLLVNWVDRSSRAGARSGSSQFQLGLYGRFEVEAGVRR